MVQHGTTSPAVTATTTDSCLDAGCHSNNLHGLHKDSAGCNVTGCHDYSAQAAKPTATTCGTGGACHNAGTPHTYDHSATASAECLACHQDADVSSLHPSCAVCHDNPAYPLLPTGKSPECASCHNGTDVGTHVYTPTDPNHYSETTHTATPFTAVFQGAGPDGLVAAGGRECSQCHSSILGVAHSDTSTSGGSVTCVECHNDTTLGSSATVAGNWPTRKCAECHDYGAATTHDSYATTHTVQPGTCADTGTSCHNFTDLASLHAQRQSGGAPRYQSCSNADAGDPSSCHNVLDTRPTPVDPAASCGQGTSGCHQDMTVSNHGAATAHRFTTASDYNAATVSGCTNSGVGCHGSDSARDNFTTYHPDSGCTGGACHTSPSKPTYAGDRECVSCHSNNYVGAPDVVGLTDLTPVGHYNETTHTAFGMTTPSTPAEPPRHRAPRVTTRSARPGPTSSTRSTRVSRRHTATPTARPATARARRSRTLWRTAGAAGCVQRVTPRWCFPR